VYETNGAGCSAVLATPVTITQPTAVMVALVAQTNETCNGGNNGSFTVTASGGGSGSYFYSTNGSGYQSSPTFSGLTAGTYTVSVTNGAGCSALLATPVTITQPSAVTVVLVSQTNETCNGGNNGSFTVSAASGGNGSYFYSTNGTGYQSSPAFSGLAAGVYNVYVTNGAGCGAVLATPVTITQPSAVTVSLVAQTNETCNGGNNGSFTVSASGGG